MDLGLCELTALSVSKSLCPRVDDLSVTGNVMSLVVTTGTLLDDWTRTDDNVEVFTDTTVVV